MRDKLAVFDLDGTLYQTHLTSVPAVNAALEEHGLEKRDPEFIKTLFGETDDRFYALLVEGASDEIRKSLAESTTFHEIRLVKESGVLYDGIVEMLDGLKDDGYKLAVCSNGRKVYVDAVLKSCGIFDRFEIVRGKEEEKEKTHVLSEILEEIDPEYAIFVGDRRHDYEAAAGNGILSIGVSYGYGGREIELSNFRANSAAEILYQIRINYVFSTIDGLVEKKKKQGKATVVGINGMDTSGKTTFSELYERHLKALERKVIVVHLDDLHNPSSVRNSLEDRVKSYTQYAFDLERLENEILRPINEGKSIDGTLKALDLENDEYTAERRYSADEDSIVIVEGVLLYRNPIDRYFDLRLYLDITFDEMLSRVEKRDVPVHGSEIIVKYKTKYIPVQKNYIERHNPINRSDLIIDNSRYERPLIKSKITGRKI